MIIKILKEDQTGISVCQIPYGSNWETISKHKDQSGSIFLPLFTYIEVEQSVPIGWAELQLIPELILLPYKQFLIVFRSKKYNIPRAQNFPLSKVQFQNNQVFQKCEEYETNDIPKYEKGLKRKDITGLIERIERIYIFLRLVLFGFFHIIERDFGFEINRLSSANCLPWIKYFKRSKRDCRHVRGEAIKELSVK